MNARRSSSNAVKAAGSTQSKGRSESQSIPKTKQEQATSRVRDTTPIMAPRDSLLSPSSHTSTPLALRPSPMKSQKRTSPEIHQREREINRKSREITPVQPRPPAQQDAAPTGFASTAQASSGTEHPPSASTVSSFTSMPTFSQSSSHRIVKNGMGMVTNSDSEEEDSDEELEDLGAILARHCGPRKPQSSGSQIMDTTGGAQSGRASTIGNARRTGDFTMKKTKFPLPKPLEVNKKFSMSELVKRANEHAAREQRLAQQNALLNSPVDLTEDSLEEGMLKPNVNQEALAEVVGGEDTKVQSVMEAMARTGALAYETIYHFFGEAQKKVESRPFPRASLPAAWAGSLRDATKREQSLLSGFFPRMARRQELPSEILLWMLDELSCEPREDLCSAYVRTLEASSKQVHDFLTPSCLDEVLRRLGAKPESTNATSTLCGEFGTSTRTKHALASSLSWILELFKNIASSLSGETRNWAIILFTRMSIDDSVRSSGDVFAKVQDVLVALITSISDDVFNETFRQVSRSLFANITSVILRHQVTAAIPVRSTRLHNFRRRLALTFALNKTKYLHADLTNPAINNSILVFLHDSGLFDCTKATDFAVLTAAANLLDIGIDSGFSDFAFAAPEVPPTPVSPASTEEQSSKDATPRGESSSRKRTHQPQTAREFATGIRTLADQLKVISSRIVDAAGGHMERTEAKFALERLEWRLLYAVCPEGADTAVDARWFGEGVGLEGDRGITEKEKMRGLMEKWAVKLKDEMAG
ncbi:hypothetical protein K402DRAFT_389036 [Aulographum hederae CBS 113979]|uniref:Uncharacterized protein n=1 Tax=Aulographum hederae CBS 113979 TaxID=1176131 RepID=A0A6G1HEI8_9PEZI|nr:hypothetical protein K402DRAFT_389036 [Aulographum hederae CBS 113979]